MISTHEYSLIVILPFQCMQHWFFFTTLSIDCAILGNVLVVDDVINTTSSSPFYNKQNELFF